MRPSQNQNRRMRGRNRNNKGPNPLTRTYDSNGPDVKIRGTAQHIADKYAQLARDAQVSGDPVAAENYFQHAEHYYRLIAAAQEQFRPAFNGYQRPFDDDADDADEEGAPFGYGGERQPQGSPNPGNLNQAGLNGAGEDDFGSQPQPFENRPEGGSQRFDRGQRPDRGDRYGRGEQGGDRGERREFRQDRGERFDRGERRDRFPRGERQDRQGERQGDRQAGDRQADRQTERQPRDEFQPRPEPQPRQETPRQETPRPEAATREDLPRRERGREEVETGGLPAFLTNPALPPIAFGEAPAEQPFPSAEEAGAAEANGRYPRRRRRRRVDAPEGAGGESTDTAAE